VLKKLFPGHATTDEELN